MADQPNHSIVILILPVFLWERKEIFKTKQKQQ